MDEIKLSDDVIEQIKDFNYLRLTKEQESLMDRLIFNKNKKNVIRCMGYVKNLTGLR
jgi:hypothetical protein